MDQSDIVNGRLAPIVLFVFKRPKHTEQTLRALQANDLADQSILYVYSDSPKQLAPEADIRDVAEVRRIVRSEAWCKEVHLIEAPHNKGLVMSFVDGITEVVNRHGKVIVLEDDQITSRGFLKFMNEALELYQHDEQVMHISGYMYPAAFTSKETTFFLQVQSCPGWGTWKRAWAHYNHDAADHLAFFSQSREKRRKFDIEGHAHCFVQLVRNAGGDLYSWAVRWHASCIRAGGLSLFPARSLVQNIGCDGTGMHCGTTGMFDVKPVDYLTIRRIPIVEDRRVRKCLDEYFRKQWSAAEGGWKVRGRKRLRRFTDTVVGTIRKPMRALARAVFPELRDLDVGLAKKCGLLSCAQDSVVSEKARLVPPYRVQKSSIGDYTSVMENAQIDLTTIGKFCTIGAGLMSGVGVVPTDGISTAPMFYSTQRGNGMTLSGIDKAVTRKPIIIGHDVHIGNRVTILGGVVIGNGAVVETGCVVTQNVPSYAVVAGNPMRILRTRLEQGQIVRMQAIAWWDWPPERLREVERDIFDVDAFIRQEVNRETVQPGVKSIVEG